MNSHGIASNLPAPMGPCDIFLGSPLNMGMPPVGLPAVDDTIGPYMCVSIVEIGKWSISTGAPAIAYVASIVLAIFAFIFIGYILGFGHARVKSGQGTIPSFDSPDSYHLWRRERMTALLTCVLIFSGLLSFIFGVSGSIELQIPFARIVTSVPGLVIILFGYLIWTRRNSSNSRR